jgi:RimJ/RimL family protein N-acetyltransferase
MDADVMRYLGGVQGRATAWRNITTVTGAWTINGFSMFSVIEKATGRWVGRLGPWQPAEWPGTEVAWGLAREAWGKGYAQEGAAAAIDWAFAELGWDEVIHTIDAENAASQKVAQRLGSRVLRHAVLPPPMNLPVDVWGQSRAEWLAGR